MDIRVLQYFLMVAREENITKAAQLLHVTQPTISRQLMQLEEELGVKLFKRSNHNINLTEEGIRFRRRAQEIVDISERAKEELAESEEELTGEIAIGCGEFQSVGELAKIMATFREENPKVHFKMQSGNNSNIDEWLEQGLLDMGLLIEPASLGKYEFVRMKQKEEWGILVRKDSDYAKRAYIKPGELVGTEVITIRDELVHHELAEWSGDYAKNMANFATYNLLYNAAMLVKQGMGPAICLRLNSEYEGLTFVPFSPKIEMSSVLAWKAHKMPSKTVNAFIKYVRKCYEQG